MLQLSNGSGRSARQWQARSRGVHTSDRRYGSLVEVVDYRKELAEMTILKGICSSLHGLHYLPVLLDNENNPATYRINIKKMAGARLAIKHLYALGHRRIAFLRIGATRV